MKLFCTLSMLLALSVALGQTALPEVESGRLVRLWDMPSRFVTPRHVDIWLPKDYSHNKRYAVLYMHDGQMLYDPTRSWNQQAWNVDDVAARLIATDSAIPFIVVGIWNAGAGRHADYFPQRAYEAMTAAQKDTVVAQLQRAGRTKDIFHPNSDNYLRFIVEELKPLVDSTYSTLPQQQFTFVAGSSMGGLISLYALCEYPQVFGGAACLSTHWPGTFSLENNPVPEAFISYLDKHLPEPGQHRIYFDYGDQTLDALYPPLQQRTDSLMRAKGFNSGNWTTRFFPGADHSENAWSSRLHIPLLFLLGRNENRN